MTADELRNELGSLIWKTATNLVHGGKVSPVQFMDFMLGSLFYRFISEDVIDYCNKLMRDAGVPDPDYANMPDEMAENAREQIINAKGFLSCLRICLLTWLTRLKTILSSTPLSPTISVLSRKVPSAQPARAT